MLTKDQVDKWILDLRSGKYSQTKFRLRTKCIGHCCLGVLADQINPDGWGEVDGIDGWQDFDSIHWNGCLPSSLVNDGPQGALQRLNDSDNLNFNQIADWIEQHRDLLQEKDGEAPKGDPA